MSNKVSTTNRICLNLGGATVIYVSSRIVREVRKHLVRLEQKYAPKRGEGHLVDSKLRRLVQEHPNHFAPSSREILS